MHRMPVLSLSNTQLPPSLRSRAERLLRAGFGSSGVKYLISPSSMRAVDLTLEDFQYLADTAPPGVAVGSVVSGLQPLGQGEVGFSLNFSLLP